MMAKPNQFTELQRSRLRFHLGYGDHRGAQWIEVRDELYLDATEPLVVFQVVGNTPDTPNSTRFLFYGEDLCEDVGPTSPQGSLLARVEKAFDLLNTATIENSQKVTQAGSVTLRTDELSARRRLYEYLCRQLALVVGVTYQRSIGSIGY